ncbi:hypothetical protein D3C74_431510 [compost metagenome]
MTVRLQLAPIMPWRLVAKSALDFDSASLIVMPKSFSAFFRPRYEDSLKDWSSNPPESETMQPT